MAAGPPEAPKVIGKVRKARSQAVVVEPPMLLTLEGKIIEMQQARDPAWTAALSSWLVAAGCLCYKRLSLSSPVKISREFFHGHCHKGKQAHNRQGFDWCAPARFSNGWHWADKWLEDYQGLAPEKHDKCGICFHPVSGQAWPIREVQRVTQHLYHGVVILEAFAADSGLLDPPSGPGGLAGQGRGARLYAVPLQRRQVRLSMRTKMRAFLAAKVADCEAWETEAADEEAKIKAAQACRGDTEVIWAQAPQTTALKRRFSLSQSLVRNARERMRRPRPCHPGWAISSSQGT